MKNADVIIVGAGPVGCVLANKLSNELNLKCLIIEKRNHIAGNCYDEYNKKGSANNPVDISIPDRFKLEETKKNEKILNNIIREIFNDYSNQFKNFLPYQLNVKNEKNIFKRQAIKIFNSKDL